MPNSRDLDSVDDSRGVDRRRFLRLLGVGGAGVAGLSVLGLSDDAWAATDAITSGNKINELAIADHGSSYDWAEKCQAAHYWAEGAAGDAPDAATQKRIQAALTTRGRYSGPVNGIWGVESIKGIQITCADVGYVGPINGIPGANTCHYARV